MRVIYKFTLVWYSTKQDTMHRPTSHLAHCDIPRNKAPCKGPRHIWHTYTLCPFFGRENTHGSTARLKISLASVRYGDSQVAHFLCPHLVSQPIWGWGNLSSFQLPLSNSSSEGAWNLGGFIYPHVKTTVSNCWVLLTTTMSCLIYFPLYNWHSFRNLMPQRRTSSTLTAKHI